MEVKLFEIKWSFIFCFIFVDLDQRKTKPCRAIPLPSYCQVRRRPRHQTGTTTSTTDHRRNFRRKCENFFQEKPQISDFVNMHTFYPSPSIHFFIVWLNFQTSDEDEIFGQNSWHSWLSCLPFKLQSLCLIISIMKMACADLFQFLHILLGAGMMAIR